uniref:Uncharacterized protein n=1 Tax=Meloidogyne enterolobii TaxID=390850 RepID=A0A6V7U491_MELEN|nr:unnamed protein product [Meloidogyne enterolobii]
MENKIIFKNLFIFLFFILKIFSNFEEVCGGNCLGGRRPQYNLIGEPTTMIASTSSERGFDDPFENLLNTDDDDNQLNSEKIIFNHLHAAYFSKIFVESLDAITTSDVWDMTDIYNVFIF